VKPVFTMRIKCAVVSAFVSIALVSQASAVLRPLFPIKPAAPFNGEVIVIGDDMVLRSTKNLHHQGPPRQSVSAREL
jgi:hypothetical protein